MRNNKTIRRGLRVDNYKKRKKNGRCLDLIKWSLFLFIGFCFCGAPKMYAQGNVQDRVEKEDEIFKDRKEVIESREEVETRYKEEEEKHMEALKKVHKRIIKRTSECKEVLDSLIFTLQSLAKQAYKKGETKKEKEILSALSDYNSVKGDLDAAGVLLSMAEFAEGEEFNRYFELMAQGYESLKGDFSLKNELFLKRISVLKDKDALSYEKKLYGLFCTYFEYDLWQDEEAWGKPKIEDLGEETGSKYQEGKEEGEE